MDKKEFIDYYIKNSGLTSHYKCDKGLKYPNGALFRIALPCSCQESTCKGWAMISIDEDSIEHHKTYYG